MSGFEKGTGVHERPTLGAKLPSAHKIDLSDLAGWKACVKKHRARHFY
jgi:hypothetical protein